MTSTPPGDVASGKRRQKAEDLVAREFPIQNFTAILVHSVNLKPPLRDISSPILAIWFI